MSSSGRQNVRQQARSTVREALTTIQKERVEREKRQAGWAVDLVAALAERDQVIAAADQVAAVAVRNLIGDGVSVAEIAGLCGDQVDAREVGRLAKLGQAKPGSADAEGPAVKTGAER